MKIKCLLGFHNYLVVSGFSGGATITPLGGYHKRFTLPSFDLYYCQCCKKIKAKKVKPRKMEITCSTEFSNQSEDNNNDMA